MIDLSTLNSPQRQAVETIHGPLLVLAGAGSGKTRVIVHRIAHMLEQGIRPQSILAVTFTNKAAAEMRERVAALVGKAEAKPLTVSTFHAFGCELLRHTVDRLGYPQKFAIADLGDQVAILKRLLKESSIDRKGLDCQKVISRISRAKCQGRGIVLPMGDEVEAVKKPTISAHLRFSRPFRAQSLINAGVTGSDLTKILTKSMDAETILAERLLPRYQRALRAQGMVDFDDLILLPIQLLETQPDIRARLQNRYRYLLVDEYQDTNLSQLKLLTCLAGQSQNICAVGDDDQSIYSWRGAEVDNILSFDRHFCGMREIRLEQNYRSTGVILDAANAVIAVNEARKDKRLWTAQAQGEKVRLATLQDDRAEGAFIAGEIQRLLNDGVAPKDIAVLYRTNAQSHVIEESLRELDIPYEVVGGQSFFDRKEIKDLLAYLKLFANPADDASLLRIVNTPPRGIGEATVEKLVSYAKQEKLTLELAIAFVDKIEGLQRQTQENIAAFGSLIRRYRRAMTGDEGGRKLRETVGELVKEIGLRQAALNSVQSKQAGLNKVRVIDTFLESVAAYTQRDGSNPPSLHGLVSKFALDGIDEDTGLSGTAVHLMTLHASKGLEWPCVFMCGMEEGLLPHPGMDGEPQNLPEERRLCYVGITRARQFLCLTRAKKRTYQGRTADRTPSRFLADIPKEMILEVEGDQTLQETLLRRQEERRSFFREMARKMREKAAEKNQSSSSN